ncbi:MAG: cobalamin B12-binding domain-containing protein, partial [Lachnospiraceae bacterium]|nr:cobalamin B12-binding domain-containing protein [Lachnospiraceae bacterium]
MEYSDLKVLLIHPEISRTRYNFVGVIENECIELEYISAMLKEKGISAQIYDGQVERESALKKIKKFSPHVVYVCGRTRQENFMLEYCREAKENDAGVRTVIGGLHAQLCYERMAKEYVDYILTSFDVYQLLNIIRAEFFGGER